MKNHTYYRFAGKTVAVMLLIAAFFIQDVCAQSSAPNIAEAVGTAGIRNRDQAKAKEEALTSAMTSGVDQVVMRLFPTDTLSQNFQKFNETILGHASDFVENYQVLAEGVSGKQYRVMLRVTVSVNMLKQKFPDFVMNEVPAETGKTAETIPETFPGDTEKPDDAIPETFPGDTEKPADTIPEEFPAETEKPDDAIPETFPGDTEKPADTIPEEFPAETEKPADTIPEEFPADTEKPAETIPETFPGDTEKPAETIPETFPGDTEKPDEMTPEKLPGESDSAAAPQEKAEEKPAETAQEEKKEGVPRILFLIAEQDLQDMDPSFWWGKKIGNQECYTENAMRDSMKAAGFQIIEHGSGLPDTGNTSHILFEPDIENTEAADVGRQMKADVVIAGKAIVYKVQDDTDTKEEGEIPSFNATLTVRVILAENGREIASLLETAVQKQGSDNQSGEQSLMTAGAEAAKKLIPQISRVWGFAKEKGDRLELIVKGTRNLGNFVRFRKTLNAMPDVKSIQIESMKSDEAEILISFGKDTQVFADAVKQMKFDSFGVEIRIISGRRLEIALIPK
ncbi:MAG: hypothetical protein AB7S75_22350 [Desulfococcaceae bacterium]